VFKNQPKIPLLRPILIRISRQEKHVESGQHPPNFSRLTAMALNGKTD